MNKIVLLYMPVIHRGYLEFLTRHCGRHEVDCVLIGQRALEALGPEADYILRKDCLIRGLPETMVIKCIEELSMFRSVRVLDPKRPDTATYTVCPDEDVLRLAIHRFFPETRVTYDDDLRLRYDRKGVARVDPVPETARLTSDEAAKRLLSEAFNAAKKSRDWWLQVGGVIARDGKPLIVAYNRAEPDANMPAILGDPRSLYSRGENTDDTLAHHAELGLVAQAAHDGISLKDVDVYVTHFPCVPCASTLGKAGVSRLFFKEGYSRLESASVLKRYNVEIIRVI